jgi:hypothetical protein
MTGIIDPLSVVAEFSIGLAGFTGIIAVFSNSSQNNSPVVYFRFVNLLVTAFAPGFFAMFTIAGIYLGLSELDSIRIVSGAFGLYILVWAASVVKRMSGMSRTEESLSTLMTWFMWTVSMLVIVLLFGNVLLMFSNPAGVLITCLVLVLVQAATTFSTLALASLRSRAVEQV